jgi:hypothetical protein
MLLLSCELHHEDVERICRGYFTVLDLLGDALQQVLEVLIVIVPVAASELGVQQSHQSVWLVNVNGQCPLVVLQCIVQLAIELKHVTETTDCTLTLWVDHQGFGVLDKSFFNLITRLVKVTFHFVSIVIVGIHA